MQNWNKMKTPPEWALKKIEGGRLKGMTDISPLWRLQIMTETYGECGIGWKYSIDRLWTEQGSEGQVVAFALVSIATKQNDAWSNAISGIGGSMLIAKEKSGLYTSDEAFKMAVTDALGNAMKALGVAASVYTGGKDSKYSAPSVDISSFPDEVKQLFREKGFTTIADVKKFCENKTYEQIIEEISNGNRK